MHIAKHVGKHIVIPFVQTDQIVASREWSAFLERHSRAETGKGSKMAARMIDDVHPAEKVTEVGGHRCASRDRETAVEVKAEHVDAKWLKHPQRLNVNLTPRALTWIV